MGKIWREKNGEKKSIEDCVFGNGESTSSARQFVTKGRKRQRKKKRNGRVPKKRQFPTKITSS
jgi:hypothetical protein